MVARRIRWAVLLGLGLVPVGALAAADGLREVDHDTVTQGACPIVVVHANAAIAAALHADDAIEHTIARLRAVRNDDSEFALRAMHADIAKYAAGLDEATARGSDESRRLQTVAGEGAAAPRPAKVRDLAGALAGIFARDREAGERIAGLWETLAIRAIREAPAGLEARTANSSTDIDASRKYTRAGYSEPHVAAVATPLPPVVAILGGLASDLEARERDVSRDESRTETLVAGAVTGC